MSLLNTVFLQDTFEDLCLAERTFVRDNILTFDCVDEDKFWKGKRLVHSNKISRTTIRFIQIQNIHLF